MGGVAHLAMGRVPLGDVGGLALVSCQIVSATVHRRYTADDKDYSEETEDQDVEHGPLDHEPLDWSTATSRPVTVPLPHRPGVGGHPISSATAKGRRTMWPDAQRGSQALRFDLLMPSSPDCGGSE